MSSAFALKKRVERGDKRGGRKKEIKGRTCTASGSNTGKKGMVASSQMVTVQGEDSRA